MFPKLAGIGVINGLGQKLLETFICFTNFNATILQLIGLDDEWLSFEHNGIQRRLPNVKGKIILEVLASD